MQSSLPIIYVRERSILAREALVLKHCWHQVPEEAAWLSREQLRCCHASIGVANEPRSFFRLGSELISVVLHVRRPCLDVTLPPAFCPWSSALPWNLCVVYTTPNNTHIACLARKPGRLSSAQWGNSAIVGDRLEL